MAGSEVTLVGNWLDQAAANPCSCCSGRRWISSRVAIVLQSVNDDRLVANEISACSVQRDAGVFDVHLHFAVVVINVAQVSCVAELSFRQRLKFE